MNYEVKLFQQEGIHRWLAADIGGIQETLDHIGLNYKQSDQWQGQEVVITIKPYVDADREIADLKSALDKIGRIANGD